MVMNLIGRAALTASQQAGAKLGTKVLTSGAAAFAGAAVKTNMERKAGEKISEAAQNGNPYTNDEIYNTQMRVNGKSAVCSGLLAGVGLALFLGASKVIESV